jgi:hypothetical protein
MRQNSGGDAAQGRQDRLKQGGSAQVEQSRRRWGRCTGVTFAGGTVAVIAVAGP